MASIETLEKVMLQQIRADFSAKTRYDELTLVGTIILSLVVTIITVWYVLFGPAFMDLWPSMHLLSIQSINVIPAPQTNAKLYEILVDQGYISIMQLKELSEMANLEVKQLLK